MTISRTVIKKPRKVRKCDHCNQEIDGETVRLYGMAERWDPPYALYLHPECEWPTARKKPEVHDYSQGRPLESIGGIAGY